MAWWLSTYYLVWGLCSITQNINYGFPMTAVMAVSLFLFSCDTICRLLEWPQILFKLWLSVLVVLTSKAKLHCYLYNIAWMTTKKDIYIFSFDKTTYIERHAAKISGLTISCSISVLLWSFYAYLLQNLKEFCHKKFRRPFCIIWEAFVETCTDIFFLCFSLPFKNWVHAKTSSNIVSSDFLRGFEMQKVNFR